MNIAILIGEGGCGGHIARKLATELANKGCQISLFVHKVTPKKFPIDHKSIQYLTPPFWLNWMCGNRGIEPGDLLFRIWKLLSKKYDVIHVVVGHRPTILIPCILAKWFRKSLLVEEWWDWFGLEGMGKYRKGRLKKIMSIYDDLTELPTKKLYDVVLPITSSLAARIPSHPFCHVLHGAIDESLKTEQTISGSRQSLGLDPNLFVLGMSNVEKWDHLDNVVLFKAFKALCDKDKKLRLLVTGDKEYLEKTLQTIVPKDRIISLGWVSFEKYKLYLSTCNLFILPYPNNPRNRGRWPNKFGDYIALHRPILTNPTGDIEIMLDKWKLGFLCPHTQDAYYKSILKLIQNPSTLFPENFKFDSVPTSELMNFDQRTDQILKYYKEALKKKI